MLLDGMRDPHALARAWQDLTDRTPILRGCVIWENVDEPVLVIHRRATIPVTCHDWRALPEAQHGALLQQILDDQDAGLDLARPPLLRLAIVQLPAGQALLIWTSHHIILDGWSLGQVIAEIFSQYAAITAGADRPRQTAAPSATTCMAARQDPADAEAYWRHDPGRVRRPHPAALGPGPGTRPPHRILPPDPGHHPRRRIAAAARRRPAQRPDPHHRRPGRLGPAAGPLQRFG